jgi:hypothetical protein
MFPAEKGTLFSGGAIVFSYGSNDLEIRMSRPKRAAIVSSRGVHAPDVMINNAPIQPIPVHLGWLLH